MKKILTINEWHLNARAVFKFDTILIISRVISELNADSVDNSEKERHMKM